MVFADLVHVYLFIVSIILLLPFESLLAIAINIPKIKENIYIFIWNKTSVYTFLKK